MRASAPACPPGLGTGRGGVRVDLRSPLASSVCGRAKRPCMVAELATVPPLSLVSPSCHAAMAAMSEETFKAMTTAIAQTIVQAQMPMLNALIDGLKPTTAKSGNVDQKSIGGPPEWDSAKEDGFRGVAGEPR